MHNIVISDTSTLILFTKIKKIELLNAVYGTVFTTTVIAAEFGKPLPSWIRVVEISNKKYQNELEKELGKGEASALALASEMENVLLMLDDLKARKAAK
ncbi:MAG TPA: hypothetical protein VKX40_12525 [Aequorivita sp.]|nr:hypothetical protein [Aequorivita sp.]